MIAMILTN